MRRSRGSRAGVNPRPSRGRRAAWLALLGIALLFTAPAGATTVVRMRARDLVASSVAAVRARVTRVESAAHPVSGALHTYVWLEPSDTLFGSLPPGPLVLRELGGRIAGRGQQIFGSPVYQVGESVLVFLSYNADGSLRTTALGLGKFAIEDEATGSRAVRRLGPNVSVLDPHSGKRRDSGDESVALSTLLARVRSALRDGEGKSHVPLLPQPPELAQLRLPPRPSFVLLNPASRWFQPDAGESIGYAFDTTGDAALGLEISRAAVNAGMAAWSALPNTNIEMFDSGDDGPAPFAGCPDDNRIVFNDPFGELDNPSNCRGVLAIGGFCNSEETRTINGMQFKRITSGKITFNNGWGGCAIWTPCNFAEIATHELGHTLGFGHSDISTATMAELAHFDGRCSSLTADEQDAVDFVYPILPTPTPTPSWTPTPIPSETGTITSTPTRSLTPSRTGTPTRTGTATRTPSRSVTRTRTATGTRTLTPTNTRVPTRTTTPSPTATPPPTRTASLTATPSRTATASATATRTATATRSASATPTLTATPTATATPRPRPGDWLDALIRALQGLLTFGRSN